MVGKRTAALKGGQRQVGKLADVPTQAEAVAMPSVSERSVRHAGVRLCAQNASLAGTRGAGDANERRDGEVIGGGKGR